MKVINRMGVVIESTTTLRVMIPACVISLTVGYLGFGSMGIFVVASVLGVFMLAGVLWTALAPNDPHDPQRLLSSTRLADYDREFLDEDGSTKHILSAPDSPADLGSSEAAQCYEKARSLGIAVVIGRSDPSGFKVSPETAKNLKIIGNTAIRVHVEDHNQATVEGGGQPGGLVT